jgi:hypothetical protein
MARKNAIPTPRRSATNPFLDVEAAGPIDDARRFDDFLTDSDDNDFIDDSMQAVRSSPVRHAVGGIPLLPGEPNPDDRRAHPNPTPRGSLTENFTCITVRCLKSWHRGSRCTRSCRSLCVSDTGDVSAWRHPGCPTSCTVRAQTNINFELTFNESAHCRAGRARQQQAPALGRPRGRPAAAPSNTQRQRPARNREGTAAAGRGRRSAAEDRRNNTPNPPARRTRAAIARDDDENDGDAPLLELSVTVAIRGHDISDETYEKFHHFVQTEVRMQFHVVAFARAVSFENLAHLSCAFAHHAHPAQHACCIDTRTHYNGKNGVLPHTL